MREPGRLTGVVVVVALFGPLFVSLAAGVALAFYLLPAPWPELALVVALLSSWLSWLLFPIFFSSIADSFDLGKLTIYPVARRDLLASAILGSIFDYPVIFYLPLSLAIMLSWGLGWQLLLVGPALLAGYGLMVLSGQLVTLILGAVLRSRRFRDAAIILVSLTGVLAVAFNYGIAYAADRLDFTRLEPALALAPLRRYLSWLPPGAVAQAIQRPHDGDWLGGAGWLLVSLLWLGAMSWGWYRLVGRLLVGSGYLLRWAGADEARARSAGSASWGWLPADIRVVAGKEIKAVWRTPARRLTVIQGLIIPLLFVAPIFLGEGELQALPDWFGLAILGLTLFNQWTVSSNMLGFEGRGLPALLLMPFSRERYFVGKTLGLAAVASPSLLLTAFVILFVVAHWSALVSLLLMPAVALVVSAVSVVVSTRFPTPVNLEKQSGNPSLNRGGCLAGFVNAFVAPLAIALLASPIIIPLLLAYWFDWWWLGAALWLPATLYALYLFRGAVGWSGRRLTAAAPEILASTALPEER